jgi:hypothetical protein
MQELYVSLVSQSHKIILPSGSNNIGFNEERMKLYDLYIFIYLYMCIGVIENI